MFWNTRKSESRQERGMGNFVLQDQYMTVGFEFPCKLCRSNRSMRNRTFSSSLFFLCSSSRLNHLFVSKWMTWNSVLQLWTSILGMNNIPIGIAVAQKREDKKTDKTGTEYPAFSRFWLPSLTNYRLFMNRF